MAKLSWQRQLTSVVLVMSFSCAALGGDGLNASGAVLHTSGRVQVNGAASREITTLFAGDSVQTTEESVANIIAGGSSVLVEPNASIKFMGHEVELVEGGVSVATSEEMAVSAYGLTFTPAARRQSRFEVVEYEDSVTVAARQGNVTVADGRQTSTVPEGQESTHKKKKAGGAAAPGAEGTHSLSGKTLAIIGGASGATVASILIAESKKKKKCVSASNNKKCKCKQDQHGNEDCEEDD